MQVQPISVKYLRENFASVRQSLKNGRSFLLIYRSEPIASLEPVKQKKTGNQLLQRLLSLSDKLNFKSNKSSVELVRQERD